MWVQHVIVFNSLIVPAEGSEKSQSVVLSLETLSFTSIVWTSGIPIDGPFPQSKEFDVIKFTGIESGCHYRHAWMACPHTPEYSWFGETGINGFPVKIGPPPFVDFWKNMQFPPDGKTYLVANGADTSGTQWRWWNDSWIAGDQVYLIRLSPSPENISDATMSEYDAGKSTKGIAVWAKNFNEIQPLLKWNNTMCCVTITYSAPMHNYLMCITECDNTNSSMNTYIHESNSITVEWKIIAYKKDFGEQGYFVNLPSKYIGKEGNMFWLLYSPNYWKSMNGRSVKVHPPGIYYGMVFQKLELMKM